MKNILSIKALQFVFVGLLALSIGIYFRLYPLIYYSSTETAEKATVMTLGHLRSNIQERINSKFPLAPKMQHEILVKGLFDETLRKDGKKIRSQIDALALILEKSQGSTQKFPYLLESDPFYYYNLTENIQKTGAVSDTIKGSKYLNKLMLAPEGHWEPLNLNPNIGYYLYNILKIFNPHITLMEAVSFTPLVVVAFALLAFLSICILLNCSASTAFVASVFFLLAPIFIKRSSLGWYDNDPYNVFFPLAILAVIFYLFSKLTSVKHNIIFSCLISLLMAVYAFFWQGWVYFFTIICLSAIIIIIKNFVFNLKKPEAKESILFLLSLAFSTFILVTIFFGASEFFALFNEGWTALINFLAPQLSLWPDLYLSVSELRSSTISYLIEYTGGIFFVLIAFLGLMTMLYRSIKNIRSGLVNQTILLTTFFFLTLIITKGAQRFTILLFIPLTIYFAYGLQIIFDQLNLLIDRFFSNLSLLKRFSKIIIVLLISSLIIIPTSHIHNNIKNILTPIYNSTWEKAMLEIKEKTPENSIINAWWPPGHFIKAIANRRVTFDGATINYPQGYWLANVFLSTDEVKALGLIRMLNNSANQATEYLQSLGYPLSTAVSILKEITPLNKNQATLVVSKYIKDSSRIEHLLKLTHSVAPPSYIFIYSEFVDNNIQLPFIGHWNFKKIEDINNNPELIKTIPKANSKEYIEFLWKLVGGPYRYSKPLAKINQKEDMLLFEENISINSSTKECRIDSKTYGKGIPRSIFYLENNAIQEKEFSNGNLPYSVMLIQTSPKDYKSILLDRPLAQSLLMKLYFYDAQGLSFLKPIISESDITGRTVIKVFEINWEKFNQTIEEVNN